MTRNKQTRARRISGKHPLQLALCRLSQLTVLLGLLSLSSMPVSAQSLTLTVPQTPLPPCGSGTCCTEFTIAPGATVTVDIIGTISPASTSCFDWGCLTAQSTATLAIGHTAGTNTFTVTNSGGSPQTFTLCGLVSCMATWDLYTAFWHDDNGNGGMLSLNTCGGTPANPCNNCDQIRAWPDNTVCVTKGIVNNTQATSVTFTFNPPLPACVRSNVTPPPGWTLGGYYPTMPIDPVSAIVFNGSAIGGVTLSPCETFCFKLPACVDGTSTTISVTMNPPGSPTPNYPCNFNASFKPVHGAGGQSLRGDEQNFPNPLTIENGFVTQIPFEAEAGEAVLRIHDQSGRELHHEHMILESNGKHHFNFTGNDLPSGIYYYVVESPKGTPIVQQSMLIIR